MSWLDYRLALRSEARIETYSPDNEQVRRVIASLFGARRGLKPTDRRDPLRYARSPRSSERGAD